MKKKPTIVRLKNGAECFANVVELTLQNLKILYERNHLAFFELVESCRNSSYVVKREFKAELRNGGYLSTQNQPDDVTKNIILSAVEGSLNLKTFRIIDPIVLVSKSSLDRRVAWIEDPGNHNPGSSIRATK
jgi:hypothetical protein